MKRTTLFSICSAVLASAVMSVAGYGCSDDDAKVTAKSDSGTPGNPTDSGGTNPTDSGSSNDAPKLGAQVDRMGRPAVNTALNKTFAGDSTAAGTGKDEWNANATASGWSAKYGPEVSANLAIYDGLDLNCGNQLGVSADAGAKTNAERYGFLGGVLANDKLWLNTAGTKSEQYLAVELNAVGVAGLTGDRGGRTLPMDVIDTTYSALAAGLLQGVGDDIAADPDKTNGTAFPYLAAPK